MASRDVASGKLDGDSRRSDLTVVVLHVPHFLKNDKSSGSTSSSTTSVAAASLFDGLSKEEVVEILRCLPLKLATRCKSVSKNWFSLISSHHFARSYLRHYDDTPPQFAIVHRYRSIAGPGLYRETPSSSSSSSLIKLTLTEPPTLQRRIVVHRLDPSYIDFQYLTSNNGWLLCCFPDPCGEIYYIVNPLTNHWITLPPIPRSSEKLCRVGFIFCADDGNSNSSFRVVRFPPTDKVAGTTMELDIFSSETGEWTQSALSFSSERSAKQSDVYDCSLNYHAIALNGKLHWLHAWFASEIFAYDPYDPEKYSRLSLPKDCLGAVRYCFGTCHGQELGKHLKYSEWEDGVVRVWELKDYERVEWNLLHRVHVFEMTSVVFSSPRVDWPPKSVSASWHPYLFAFHPWNRDVVLCLEARRFLQYNLKSKTLEVFQDQGQEIKLDHLSTMTFFLFELPWWPTPVPSVPGLPSVSDNALFISFLLKCW